MMRGFPSPPEMKHFILPGAPNPEGMIRLYEKDYHYIVRVRRLKTGMCFDAILPGGEETQIRILSTADNILIGECLGTQGQRSAAQNESALLPPIVLFQGLPRGSKMDLIVRQAAECGVPLVVPFESEYSTVRLNKESPENRNAEKLKRWEKIVKEARQQSGSSIETKIKTPCGFNGLLEYWESVKREYTRPLGILLHQEPPENEPLAKGSFHGYLGNNPGLIALAVGPEGGFSPKEVSLFLAAGFKSIMMGNTILRTETAALYGTAAIRTILLENKEWMLGLTE